MDSARWREAFHNAQYITPKNKSAPGGADLGKVVILERSRTAERFALWLVVATVDRTLRRSILVHCRLKWQFRDGLTAGGARQVE